MTGQSEATFTEKYLPEMMAALSLVAIAPNVYIAKIQGHSLLALWFAVLLVVGLGVSAWTRYLAGYGGGA